ncbi:hypothetical protein PG984_003961 [Apiospora sp. TS-2023a]
MKFSAATLFLAATSSVSAANVARDDGTFTGLVARENMPQQAYDLETNWMKEQGKCRIYKQLNVNKNQFMELCEPKCGKLKEIAKDGKTHSVTCFSRDTKTWTDPEKHDYVEGDCKCDLPIVNWAGENFVAALPAVGQVTCAVWTKAIEDAAKILTSVNGIRAAETGSAVLLKVAKMLFKQGKSESSYEKYVKEHLAKGDACDKFDVKKMWNKAKEIPDSILGI